MIALRMDGRWEARSSLLIGCLIHIGGHAPPLLEAMHDRLADGWTMRSAKLSHHWHLIHIGGHAPPLLDSQLVVRQRRCMNSDSGYPPLRFLSEWTEIRKSRNHLPHWDAGRITCFITFRLADSLPADLLAAWRVERDAWLEHHPKPWPPETEAAYHKRFSTRIDQALDAGHGSCLLRAKEAAAFVSDTLTRCDAVDYLLHSWVIMPNHVHVLVSPFPGKPLAGMVAGWKRFSATRIHKESGATGALWQKDYFDRLIRDWNHFINVARYIRRNPEKAGLAEGSCLLHEAEWVQRLLS